MKKVYIITLLLLLMVLPAKAGNYVRGVIAFEDNKCVIIYTTMGYTLGEKYSYQYMYEEDQVVGDLHSYGFKDIYNMTRDNTFRIWIVNYFMSENRVVEEYYSHCK